MNLLIPIIIAAVLVPAGAYDLKLVLEKLTDLGCENLTSDNTLNDWYLNVYREITEKNPFAEIFDVPLSFPSHTPNRQLTLYSLARDNDKRSDGQIAFILGKLERLRNAQKRLPDFKKLGIQETYRCFYKQKKVFGINSQHITRIVFEEDTLGVPLKDSVKSMAGLMYLVHQLAKTYEALEPTALNFFGLTIDDFYTKTLSGNFVKVVMRNHNLGAYTPATVVGEARDQLMSLDPLDMYLFPGFVVKSFMLDGKLEEWQFGPYFNRWKIALIILELCGVDVRKIFDSPACESVFLDPCLWDVSKEVSTKLEARFGEKEAEYVLTSAIEGLVRDLMKSKDAKKMREIVAEFEQYVK